MTIFYDPSCLEYSSRGHPEGPERVGRSAPLLKNRHPHWVWRKPTAVTDVQLLRAHSRDHINRVVKSRHNFDADTPFYPNIEAHARRSAGAAIGATRSALQGEPAFSLMRPPGHHATRDCAMGFCYFSNVAVAALDTLTVAGIADAGLLGSSVSANQPPSRSRGTTAGRGATSDQPSLANTKVERVAIWDFDGHHGNGTEAIVVNNERIRFASIHQFPAYPGTGTKSFAHIDNYPIGPYTPRESILDVARRSLEKLIDFEPDLLLVSAGFDAYARDPLLQLTLEREDFAILGDWLRDIDVPAAVMLEGGYSDDLPELIDAFLMAWAD